MSLFSRLLLFLFALYPLACIGLVTGTGSLEKASLEKRVSGQDLWNQLLAALQQPSNVQRPVLNLYADLFHVLWMSAQPFSTAVTKFPFPSSPSYVDDYTIKYYTDVRMKAYIVFNNYQDTYIDGQGRETKMQDQGILTMAFANRAMYVTGSYKEQMPYRWSDYAFTILSHYQTRLQRPSDLVTIYQGYIDNDETLEFIEDMWDELSPGAYGENSRTIAYDHPAWFELIKTPNMVGVIYLLKDHADVIGKMPWSVDIAGIQEFGRMYYTLKINLDCPPASGSSSKEGSSSKKRCKRRGKGKSSKRLVEANLNLDGEQRHTIRQSSLDNLV